MAARAKLGGCMVAVVCVLVFSAATAAGQTKKPIKFMKLTDLTGPASAQVGPMGWAAEDYINWLNKKEGGIDGHPVELELIDTKYDLTLIRSAYARFKGMKQATLNLDSLSGGIEALRQQYDKDKIPVMMETGHGPALYPAAWTFGLMPPYDDVLCAFADWIKRQWKEARKPRVALFLGDYASGRSPQLAKWYCEKVGVEVVAEEICPLRPTDTSDLLIRIRDAKPDYIFDTLMPDQAKVVLRDKQKLDIKIPQINFVFNSDLIAKTVPPEAYEGYMGFEAISAWWVKDVPGVQLSYKLYEKRGEVPPYAYIGGVGGTMIWIEAVKNALRKVGYEKLDGPAIFDGYVAIKGLSCMGIFKEIDYTKGDRRGNKWLRISKLNKDGSVLAISEWMEAPWNLKLKQEAQKETK
jgi:ABC-type branched-subunit amino acid transport system substrate-binding protein